MRSLAEWSIRSAGRLLDHELGPDDVEPPTWAMANLPVDDRAVTMIAAAEATQQWAWEVSRWWAVSGCELLVTPTVPQPAALLSETADDPSDPMRVVRRSARSFPFVAPFNTTGDPAISLPLHQDENNLPVGIQLVAPYPRDDIVLRVAAELERARPWRDRNPPE